jgi:hypothetical protein
MLQPEHHIFSYIVTSGDVRLLNVCYTSFGNNRSILALSAAQSRMCMLTFVHMSSTKRLSPDLFVGC